jgi:hypothetical protein
LTDRPLVAHFPSPSSWQFAIMRLLFARPSPGHR